MNLDELTAHIEIRQALVRYCRGVDRGDAELIKSAFHEDAKDEHGPFTGNREELAALIVSRFDAAGITGQHQLTNIYIELDGDRARVESYFLALRPQRDAAGNPELVPLSGRYLDRFERRGRLWRIMFRQVVFDWMRMPIPATDLDTSHGYPAGARRGEDLSAALFPRADS